MLFLRAGHALKAAAAESWQLTKYLGGPQLEEVKTLREAEKQQQAFAWRVGLLPNMSQYAQSQESKGYIQVGSP